MMKYVALICDSVSGADGPMPCTPEFEAYMAPWIALDQRLKDDGVFVAGEALMPVATATCLRIRGGGWLLRVGHRLAIDRLRRDARFADRARQIAVLVGSEAGLGARHEIPDERLRLIFTCCHPALEPKSRMALTLRTLGGLTTDEIARLSRQAARDGAAPCPRETQDTGCRDRLRGAGGRRPAGAHGAIRPGPMFPWARRTRRCGIGR